MITIELWRNGLLIQTKHSGRKSGLGYMRAYNLMAERRFEPGRWIIASNGLRN